MSFQDPRFAVSDDCITDDKTLENVSKYLVRFLEEARKSNFPILTKIDDQTASQIWVTACQFIEKQLESGKAVAITQLGTFTFSSKRLDIGNNKHIVVQRPVFLFSERLAQIHGITYTKHHVSGEIPVVKMNFTAIAIAMGSERDLIEGAIREILQALSRVIASREAIQFMFHNIGYLMVRDFRARVKFTPDFIKRMDGTGQLSKIIKRKKSKTKKKTSDTNVRQISPEPPIERPRSPFKHDSPKLPEIQQNEPTHTQNQIPRAELFSSDQICQNNRLATLRQDENGLFSRGSSKNGASDRPSNSNQRGRTPRINSATSVASSVDSAINTDQRLKEFLAQSKSNVDILNNLSYVAYQRKMMNEERKARDNQADAVLQRFQDSKDRAVMKKEKNDLEAARERARQVAAFNLETSISASDTVASHKNNKLGQQARAYIFQERPLTPARFEKQINYSNALGSQVEKKLAKSISEGMEIASKEKAEQKAISDEIKSMSDQRFKTKMVNQKKYRKALSSQIRVKKKINDECAKQEELAQPSHLLEPSVPYFGKNDMNKTRMNEEKERAKSLFQSQLGMSNSKRKDAIKRHLSTQEAESQVLRRTKTELIQESIDNYKNSVNRRRALEQNWVKHAKDKRQREAEYQDFMKNDRFLLEKEAELHDKYSFMFKPKPCGYLTGGRFKSNIWRESRYIPGSRLIL